MNTPPGTPAADNAGNRTHRERLRGYLLLVLCVMVCAVTARDFLAQHRREPVVAGPGVCETHMLSRWFEPLKAGPADTEAYLLAGDEEDDGGARVLVLGGVHPNEPAGYLAALLLVENLEVDYGRLWVIPRTNASAFSATEPQEGHPQVYELAARDGSPRRFRLGSRLTNPLDQWPDPEIAAHHPSGQRLSGSETRNLNRCFPGRPDGTHTEQLAWAISRLIATERIELVIDMHEASIEYPVINAIVSHERAQDIAATALFGLEMEGFLFNLEPSPKNLHGLSHRELGDHFESLYALLMETANPIQGRLRGRTQVSQIIEGTDECYVRAEAAGMNKVPFTKDGIPLRLRVTRHLLGFRELVGGLAMTVPGRELQFRSLPEKDVLLEEGLAPYLLPVTPEH
jgi:hypothetical protein